MRHLRPLALWLTVAGLAGCGPTEPATRPAVAPPPRLTIFYTCDTRGHIEPCGCVGGVAGGVARRATCLAQQRTGPAVLVDAGDLTAGPRDWELLELKYLLAAYQEMGYAAVNAGHREASLGVGRLRELAATTPLLISANLVDQNGQRVLPASRVVDVGGGYQVGLLGVMDERIAPADLGAGLRVTPAADAVARELPALQRNSDLVVLLAFANETRLRELAERFYEIAAVVGGQVTQPSATPIEVNQTAIVYITDKGKSLGRLDLEWTADGRRRWTNEIVMLDDRFPDDPGLAQLVADFKRQQEALGLAGPQHRDDEEGLSLIAAPRSPEANQYVGAEACRDCHASAYASWAASAHARALESLTDRGYQTSPRCLACHTVGHGATDGFRNPAATPALGSVSCEACHGRGGNHVRLQAGETVPAKAAAFKTVDCAVCHDAENSPQFARGAYWAMIQHGREPAKP